MKKQLLILVALFGLLRVATAQSDGGVSPPVFLNIMRTGSGAMLQWKADTGSTQWVERALDLNANPLVWTPVFTNLPPTPATNTWTDTDALTQPQAFYRIRAQVPTAPPEIGQMATFTTRSHGVSGVAKIVDAQTIRVTNFNYDGRGVVVYMIVSVNSGFAPYTQISGDLIRGVPYVNETLDFTIPPGTNLADINYISVWCVVAGVSFGDGQFQ